MHKNWSFCVCRGIPEKVHDNFMELGLSSHIYAGSRDQTHATVLWEQALLPLSYSIGPSWCFFLLSIAFLSPQGRSKCCDFSSLARLGFSLVLYFLSLMTVCIFYSQTCWTNCLICLRRCHTAHRNHISAKILVNGCSVDTGPSAGNLSLLMFLSVFSW